MQFDDIFLKNYDMRQKRFIKLSLYYKLFTVKNTVFGFTRHTAKIKMAFKNSYYQFTKTKYE